jgi:hypothetical protein
MNPALVALYAIAVILGAAIMIVPFGRRLRDASLWLRLGLFINGPLAIAWGTLGFYLRLHEANGKTAIPWSWFWNLEQLRSNIAGLTVGLLVCLLLSPESRRLDRSKLRL